MGNRYLEVKRQNEELMNRTFEGVVFFAFSNEQFRKGMEKIGARDESELYKMGNTGGFYKKTDADIIRKLFADMQKAEEDALEEGGEEYAGQMFSYELDNHEFGYTMELEDTLYGLGLDPEEIQGNPVLYNGLKMALKRFGVTPGYYGIKRPLS